MWRPVSKTELYSDLGEYMLANLHFKKAMTWYNKIQKANFQKIQIIEVWRISNRQFYFNTLYVPIN